MAIAESHSHTDVELQAQWPELCKRIERRSKRRNLETLWPFRCADGSVLRWGLRALSPTIDPVTYQLSRFVGGYRLSKDFDLGGSAERFIESHGAWGTNPAILTEAIAWAYALPSLATKPQAGLSVELWWQLVEELQTLHRTAIAEARPERFERLLAGGEIGAVLGWQLADLPSCEALLPTALSAISEWFQGSGDSVAAAVEEGGRYARVALASALRSRRLSAVCKQRIGVRRCGAAIDLAAWVAAMTRKDGSQMLATHGNYREDTAREGLFELAATEVGDDAMRTAFAASLGKTKGDGKLAWQVELPEPAWFDEEAKLAVMLPEWDVRRGRLAIDYSQDQVRLEICGGKRPLLEGVWTCDIELDGTPLKPTGPWTDICWHSDDDVHYLELERSYASSIKVQRQIFLIRDDRAIFLADSVIGAGDQALLFYQGKLHLPANLYVEEERETRELWLCDTKRRALVLPLGLNEWKVGPSQGKLSIHDSDAKLPNVKEHGSEHVQDDDRDSSTRGLVLNCETHANKALTFPLWLDLHRPRFKSARTWRPLTIGEKLRLVPAEEARAFRVHVGSEQWVLYRSLTGAANRTFLGKNLISEFFCGRFETEEGTFDELIAVDEQPE